MFKIAAILTSAAMLCTGTLLAAAPEAYVFPSYIAFVAL